MNRLPGSDLTIGYLTPRIGDNVSQALWSGVVDAARERGAKLICFAGDILRDDAGFPSPANVVYDLVNLDMVDGLVSWASSLGGSLTHGGVVAFHHRYQPLPMVSITLPMPGVPTISIDSYQGMLDVIAHLIEFHGHRRLAFIRGPEGHYYAQERYRAYADALSAHGIPVDPKLVTTPGDFVPSAGVMGMRLLLDERKLRPQADFEAVVTVSDLPALGALQELGDRGIAVPEAVALAGFNDAPEGRFVTPPLTTVRLPFYEQGRRAVEMLLALLAGEQAPEQVVLPAELKVRRSCGCLLPSVAQAAVHCAGVPGPVSIAGSTASAFAAQRESILDAMAQAAEACANGLAPDWAERLLDAFVAEAAGNPTAEGVFLRALDQNLRLVILAGGQVESWQGVISALRGHSRLCVSDDPQALRRAEDLWGQARVLIGEAAQRARGHNTAQRARQIEALRQINQALVTTFDVAELADVLAQDLPSLGIECCYLALYKDPQQPGAGAKVILAYDERGRIDPAEIAEIVEIPFAIPAHRSRALACSVVVEPLYFRDEQLGFVLFGIGPKDGPGQGSRDGVIYDVLRGQIGSSLKGALLFDEIRQARIAAEKADQLKTRLLANVSHELRTPLNVIIGSTREMLALTPDGAALPDGVLHKLEHIHHSAEHQLRVINDLLDLSRAEIDELDLYLELLDPRPLLEEAFDTLRLVAAGSRSSAGITGGGSVTWHLRLPDRLPVIQADPVRLRQILLNLLSNAAKFVERGQVILGAEVTPPYLHIWVRDTGPGIPDEMQERIFEPFTTLARPRRAQAGVGLGLSITRRLVALHQGSMRVESYPGQGSTFHVYLPLPLLSDRPSTPPSFPAVEAGTSAESGTGRPVLLLISSHDRPAAEIVEFSRCQGLEIHKLRASDDLDAVMQRVQPAALAWDLADAGSGDWLVIRRLRNHPKLSQAPFILYGQQAGKEAALSIGMTDFVAKPVNKGTLVEVINDICPPELREAGPVLIVDDDPQVLDSYRDLVALRYPGYSIQTAADGTAALACMAEETPSLVILDLMMPEMDGFDVLSWMRANARTRRVPVLVLSSRVLTFDDVKRLEQHAMVTLHSKGILSADEMAASLHRALFGTDALPQHTSALVKQAVAYFHQNYNRPLSRWEIAAAIGVSEDYLSQIFRQELDISPWEYLNRYRILQAIERLGHTNDSLGAVARQVGFKDPAYFSRVFHKVMGLSPTEYRDRKDKEGARR